MRSRPWPSTIRSNGNTNAGILGTVAPMIDYPIDTFDRVIAINLRSVFLGLRCVLPVMVEQRAGSIINTGSMGSAGGYRGAAPITQPNMA